MAKLTFRRIADPGAEDSYYLEPKGRFMAYDGETNVGFINFLRYPRDLSLHLDYLMVRPEYRGRGVGEVILRKFREWLHRNASYVKYAASEVTSQKSLHLMNKVFGPPLYMSNGVRLVTLDEAMRALPASMETNEHGGLDAEGHIDVVHWIGVGRAPKDHPWVERAAGGASGTARRGHARGRAGRSSGRVYPSERSPSFIASLPAERRALAERFLRVLSGRPHWARFHEYLAEAPVGEIQADVAEREAAHARRGEQAKADAREEAQRRRKFRGAVEVEVDPKDRRKQRLSGQDVWLYHGTSSKLLSKIRKEGLCPDPPRRAAPDTSSGYVYLTVRAGSAMDRGGDAVFYARQAVGVFGGEPVVLRVRVPWDALDRDEDDSDLRTYHYQYRFAGCIRPEQIAEVLKV